MEDDWFLAMCYRSCHQRGTLPSTKNHLALVNVYRLFEILVSLPQNVRHNVSDDVFGDESRLTILGKAGHPPRSLSRRWVSNSRHEKRGQRETSL